MLQVEKYKGYQIFITNSNIGWGIEYAVKIGKELKFSTTFEEARNIINRHIFNKKLNENLS